MPWLSWMVSNLLFAVVLALGAWFVQRHLWRYALAHVLWMLVLIKLVTPPLVTVPLGESSREPACAAGTCDCGTHTPTPFSLRDGWPWALAGIWGAGAVAMTGIVWHRWKRFQRLVAHASPAPPEWTALAADYASRFGIRSAPTVLAVPGRLPPMVVPGWRRPLLLLPMDLISQIDAPQRSALLLHELTHIRRGDHRVRLLEIAVAVAYWWLPIVRVIGRQLRACEESCCDEAVVAERPDARRDYARLLLDVIDFADPLPVRAVAQATAMSAAAGLEERLRAILHGRDRMQPTRLVGVFAAGLACVILPVGFRFDIADRSPPVAAAADFEPGAAVAPSTNDGEEKLPKLGCCPS